MKTARPLRGFSVARPKTGPFSGILATGTITEKNLIGELQGKTVAELMRLIASGKAYVNVLTETHPAGEIRGEIGRSDNRQRDYREANMNADILLGRWKELKGDVKRRWGKLTDDDITEIAGMEEMLLGVLQKNYGYARDEAEREYEDFMSNLDKPVKRTDEELKL